MSLKKGQSTQVDLNTLDLLPIAVAIFDNKKVYFVNKKAAELFHISKEQIKNITSVSIFQFLDPQFHKRIKENNTKILKGEDFPPVELTFKTFKNRSIFIEAKSNCVLFENKKLVQTTFIEISELKQKQIELEKSEELLLQTKDKFDLITKSSNDIIAFYTYFPIEKYVYVSPNITKILGYEPSELLKDHNFFNKKVVTDKKDFLKIDGIIKNYQKKNTKKNYTYTFKTIKKNREEVWLENNLTPITNSDGKIAFYLNIIRDITVQKEKEIELQQQHINYRNLLDSSPVSYIIHRQGVTVFCNQAMLDLLKLKSEKQILGKFALDYIIEKERMMAIERVKDIYKGVDAGKSTSWTIKDSKGNLIETEMTSTPINFNNSKCILTLIINITEQRKIENEKIRSEMIKTNNEFLKLEIKERQEAEKKLLEKTSHLSSIFESSNHYIWTINAKQKLTSFNKNYFELVESIYNTKPYVGFILDRGVLRSDKDYNEVLEYNYKKAFSGNSANFEMEILDKNYNKIYLEVFLNPVYHNKTVEEVSGIAHNITDKKLNHQRVEQSLKEKDVLLKEVHHRVKNNMQIISSILNLQSSYVTDAYTLALLKESQNRIKTMAYIHESLYQNKSFTSVNFSEYIQTLSKNIIHSYVVSAEKIELLLNLEKINLNLDASIPAGLIINELITNAIKHAFSDTRKGYICLNLKQENNIICLEVKDNGVGIPPGFDFNNTNTLGLQLVNTLIDQLDGEIKFNSKKGKGTEVLIKFKM